MEEYCAGELIEKAEKALGTHNEWGDRRAIAYALVSIAKSLATLSA